MAKDDGREFRFRPRKPPARNERAAWASAYKILMHHARLSGGRNRRSVALGGGPKRARPHNQRCAVRVTYAKNTVAGQWRAHGRYVARESATHDGDPKAVGFDGRRESIDIAARLESWQKAGDERFWKSIVSPEFGDRADLKRLTRELVSRMEKDLGIPLEWVAAAHYNTEHPHVHMALRGIGAEGRPLNLSRDYIRLGIREIAEDLCTRQLGHRTEWDAAAARRREVHQHRYTSLDRIIKRDAKEVEDAISPFFMVVAINSGRAGVGRSTSLLEQHIADRLKFLDSMGLAEPADPNTWRVRQDFENVLRAMQRSADRQNMLAAHGVLMSDERMPLAVLDLRRLTALEGRILVHGEEDTGHQEGRSYFMLEGTDGQVHYVYYTPELEAARSQGGLRNNSFVRLRKLFAEGHPVIKIDELGDSESILHNKAYMRETAQRLIRHGMVPQEEGWNGWLGRYQKALTEASMPPERPHPAKDTGRDRRRDHGR
jgi:type IV secretory pathway VirD2 relaxase